MTPKSRFVARLMPWKRDSAWLCEHVCEQWEALMQQLWKLEFLEQRIIELEHAMSLYSSELEEEKK